MEGNKDFLVEVGQLSQLQHPNLVNLIGYCADGDQRLLVYEFMPGGSVEDHLLDMKAGGKPLDWITRMKIAYGTAQALEYLHEKGNPPVIYRDLKSSNVLLDEQFNAKLSDIGLDKLGPSADKMPMQSRAMGTYGYIAPEYSRSGKLTTVADVYSFGVVLLELITGRRAVDTTKPVHEQNLVAWAQPIFKEPKQFPEMADPLLEKRFPERGLNQAVAIAAMCLQDEAAARPLMSDLVMALSFLSISTEENSIPPTLPASISSKLHCISTKLQFLECPDVGKVKKQDSSVDDADTDSESAHDHDDQGSESDHNQNDQGSVSSCYISSVSRHEESALTHDHSRRPTDGSDSSREESTKDLHEESTSLGHASSGEESGGVEHDRIDSLSQKSIKNSQFSSSQKYSEESEHTSFSSSHKHSRKLAGSLSHKSSRKSSENDANLSGSDSPDESFSTTHKKSNKKLLDESRHSSQKGSKKSNPVSVSHKSGLESQDVNDSFGHNSTKNLADESVSVSHKIGKKSKDGSVSSRRHKTRGRKTPDGSVSLSQKSKRKSQQGNYNSSRASNDESNSSGSSRKSRRRSKKVINDSISRSSSNGGSQD
ncbi:hypothetical protein DITRI_Ditri06bG0099900 [Diplodiscus trichospermus]